MATTGPEQDLTTKDVEDVMNQQSKPFVTVRDVTDALGIRETVAREYLENLDESTELESGTVRDVHELDLYWLSS